MTPLPGVFGPKFMKPNETQKVGFSLKQLETVDLDKLMADVLREMRRRDSDHVKGDVIDGTRTLRKLRSSGKLP
jgi:hypothetical protein